MIVQIFTNGLISGLLIALVALGFSLIYSATKIFHIAHGAVYTAATYLFITSLSLINLVTNFNPTAAVILAIPISFIFVGLLSWLFETIVYHPLLKKKAPSLINLVSSLGIYMVIVNIISLIFSNETKIINPAFEPSYIFAGVIFTRIQIIQLIVSILLIILLFVVLHKTYLGSHIRALADNPILLNILGFNINRIRLAVFLFGSLLAASASLLKAFDVGVDPHVGLPIILTAAVAVIIGGIGSHYGAVIAAIFIGILQNFVVWYASAQWQDTLTYLVLSLVLIIRRRGLYTVKLRVEEQ